MTDTAKLLAVGPGVALKIDAAAEDLIALGVSQMVVDVLQIAANRLEASLIMSPTAPVSVPD